MKVLLVIVATLLLCANAQAQLRKCTGPDGRVTYSDVLCAGGATTGSIKNANGNSLDTSGFRREVEGRATASAMQVAPIECKFKSYNNNDEKGKVLADQAQVECVKNIQSAKKGLPQFKEAYTMWKDHYDQTTVRRQGAVNRAISTLNADTTARSNANRSLTCKPNMVGDAIECR